MIFAPSAAAATNGVALHGEQLASSLQHHHRHHISSTKSLKTAAEDIKGMCFCSWIYLINQWFCMYSRIYANFSTTHTSTLAICVCICFAQYFLFASFFVFCFPFFFNFFLFIILFLSHVSIFYRQMFVYNWVCCVLIGTQNTRTHMHTYTCRFLSCIMQLLAEFGLIS